MSDALLISLAKAVTSELDGGSFSQEFTPERSYGDWEMTLEDNDTLHVDVVPVKWTARKVTQASYEYECLVDVGIRIRFLAQEAATGRVPVATVDPYVRLLEELAEFFAIFIPSQDGRQLTDLPEAILDADGGLEIRTSKLDLKRQYTGILRLKFLVDRT